jgi:hypothetical protein
MVGRSPPSRPVAVRLAANALIALAISACWSSNATPPSVSSAADVASPVTISAKVSGDFVEGGKISSVRLAVRGVAVRGNDNVVGFKVFLNKQDATPETPRTDPHYVGAFALGELSKAQTQSVNLDATRVFRLLAEHLGISPRTGYTATLVPIIDSTQPASKAQITAKEAELRILPAVLTSK